MECSWHKINLGWRMGAIGEMTSEALEIAKLLKTTVTFEFNGTIVEVKPNGEVVNCKKRTIG